MNVKNRAALLALSMLLSVASVHAAEAVAPTGAGESAIDPEEQLDDGLKSFGYLTGLAHGCVTTSQRAALEKEAIDLHAAISRLLGTDRAFLFSSAFGYGTTVTVETKDCKEVLDRYDARVAKFRAGQTGGSK
jgi:hypothetical protein